MTSIYSLDNDSNEVYPPTVKSDYSKIYTRKRYARKSDGTEYYPKTDEGDEFKVPEFHTEIPLIQRNGEYIYPLYQNGNPKYDKISENDLTEKYEKINDKWIIGKTRNGDQKYARSDNGDEYYPPDNTIAMKANGKYFYAKSNYGDDIFPKDSKGNEIYISMLVEKDGVVDQYPVRYAKTHMGDEYYPRLNGTEIVLDDTYASTKDKKYFYPKDKYNNEFYKMDADFLLERYAVTNDGKIILPEGDENCYIPPITEPKIKKDNILGHLIRNDGEEDYLTNISSKFIPQVERKPYQYKDKNNRIITVHSKIPTPSDSTPYPKCYIWIIILFIIAIIFIGWIFYFFK